MILKDYKETKYKIIWNLENIFSYFTSSSHLIQVRSPWDLYNNAVINSVFENCLKCKSRSSSAVKARVQIIKSSNVPSIRRLIFDWNFLMWRFLWLRTETANCKTNPTLNEYWTDLLYLGRNASCFQSISFLICYACFDYFIGFPDWHLGGLKHISREFFA